MKRLLAAALTGLTILVLPYTAGAGHQRHYPADRHHGIHHRHHAGYHGHHYRRHQYRHARYRHHRYTGRRCRWVVVSHAHRHKSIMPVLVGGTIGGIIGHEVSGGDDAGTIAGSVIGAIVARSVSRRHYYHGSTRYLDCN